MKNDVLLDKVKQGLIGAGLSIGDKPRLLVAVSGGADSVCLLRALLMLECDCIAAHCNFHLRGEESNRDEQFVRNLCQQLGVELHVKDFDIDGYRRQHKNTSVEMACRDLRYEWFYALRIKLGCKLVIAHHADDNVETFFLNLMRGTGSVGLTGMGRNSRHIVRPMLDVTRAEVLQWLASIGQDYVTDSTNLANGYGRNRLRNVVLPTLEHEFPGATNRVRDTMSHLADERQLLDFFLRRCEDELTFYDEDTGVWYVTKDKLFEAPQPGMLLYALFGYMGFNRTQCDQAVKAVVGARFYASSNTLIVERKYIVISPVRQDDDEEHLVVWNELKNLPVSLIMNADNPPFSPAMVDGKHVVAFSNDMMKCSQFVLRHWRQGDRFRPFGMKGSKLVSDLFVDMKLSTSQKSAAWLLEADGKILWVLGYRAAHEFVVTPGTTDYVIFRYNSFS